MQYFNTPLEMSSFTIHRPKTGLVNSYRIADPMRPMSRNTGTQGFPEKEFISVIQNFIPDGTRYCEMDYVLPSSMKKCFFKNDEQSSDYDTILIGKEVGTPYIKGCFRNKKTGIFFLRTGILANIEAERRSKPSHNKDWHVEVGPLFNADVSFWCKLKELLKQKPKLQPQQMTVFEACQFIKDRDGWFTRKQLCNISLTKGIPPQSISHVLQELRDQGILEPFSQTGTPPNGRGTYKLTSAYM